MQIVNFVQEDEQLQKIDDRCQQGPQLFILECQQAKSVLGFAIFSGSIIVKIAKSDDVIAQVNTNRAKLPIVRHSTNDFPITASFNGEMQ